MDLEFLKPSKRLRVMDLVANVGIDVSDWKNFKGGVVRAASNPKYCYEWSYEDSDKKLVALNLWYEDIEVLNGEIVQRLNLRETANNVASSPQVRRAKKMDALLGDLSSLNRPARVIICHSERNREGVRVKSCVLPLSFINRLKIRHDNKSRLFVAFIAKDPLNL